MDKATEEFLETVKTLDCAEIRAENERQPFSIKHTDYVYVTKKSLEISRDQNLQNEYIFNLTESMIRENSSDYTAWQQRFDILRHLGFRRGGKGERDRDLRFCYDIVNEFSGKSYQLWNYRRNIAASLVGEGDGLEKELEFCRWCLDRDQKNIHAWSQLQALILVTKDWSKEMDYVNNLVIEDVHNNSAWNQKQFLLTQILGQDQQSAQDAAPILEREFQFVRDMILEAPYNQSSWNYLKGLLSLCDNKVKQNDEGLQEIFSISEQVLRKFPSCPHALEGLLIYYQLKSHRLKEVSKNGEDQNAKVKFNKCCDNCIKLVDYLQIAEPGRTLYWHAWKNEFQKSIET